MPTGVADRIAGYVTEAYKSLPRRGAEAGGLLLGGVRLGPVIDIFITGFEPITCDHVNGPSFTVSDAVQKEFRTAMSRQPAAEIIGFYRSHTRKSAGLDLSDQEIVDRIFPGLSGLVLLIRPSGVSTLDAGYFFFQNGRLEMRPVGPEFPFLVSLPGGTPPPAVPEPEPVAGHDHVATVPAFREMLQESLNRSPEPPREPSPEPVRPARHTRAALAVAEPEVKRRERLQWEIVAAGLMVAAALALLWWQYRGASGDEEAAAGPSHVVSLGLAVHPDEGGWRITWDPKTAAARDSVRGALDVTDDQSHERIPLSSEQIRAGAANYRPSGDDLIFRLDLFAGDNSLASETYRVLRPHEIEAAVPSRPPAAKRAQPTEPAPTPKPEKATPPKPGSEAEENYVESAVVSRVAPEVGEGIRSRIIAPLPIDVKVLIDREGHVTRATPVQHEDGLVDYLAKRAVAAAMRWTFTPAKRDGKAVASTRTIHFVFEQ
jgi:hypothetical protein